MSKQIIDALNNISKAIDVLSSSIKNENSNSSDTTSGVLNQDTFLNSIETIAQDVKSIKQDTTEILKKQDTLIQMQKQQSAKTGLFTGIVDNTTNIVSGVATIGLIAGAVLAMGQAFQVVGHVDFTSVVGLSLSIFTLALSFERISKLKLSMSEALVSSGVMLMLSGALVASSHILKYVSPISIAQGLSIVTIATLFAGMSTYIGKIGDGVNAFSRSKLAPVLLTATLIGLSTAITASSWILRNVTPVTLQQGATALLISGVMGVITHNIDKIGLSLSLLNKTGIKPWQLPLFFGGIATAITASSWIMSGISPLSIGQGLTAIGISLGFTIIAYNMHKIAGSLVAMKATGIKNTDLVSTLVGISTAITASSWILNAINPVSVGQALTGVGIALMFAGISTVMPNLAIGLAIMKKTVSEKDLYYLPKLFVAISGAISLSSWVLSTAKVMSLSDTLKLGAMGVAISASSALMASSMILINKIGNVSSFIKASLSVVAISGLIATTSHILAKGNYGNNYPTVEYATGVASTMLPLGAMVYGLGKLSTTEIIKGSASAITIATMIPLISHLISNGDYTSYPSFEYAKGVGLSMIPLGLMAIGLGKLSTTELIKGTLSAVTIATMIPLISHLLSNGDYTTYPSLDYSIGVSASMLPLGLLMFGMSKLNPASMLKGAVSLLAISGSVVSISHILRLGTYETYPSLEWAKGVGLSMGALGLGAVLLGTQAMNPLFYAGLGVTTALGVAIVGLSHLLKKGDYTSYPPTEWVNSTILLFGKFGATLALLGLGSPLLVAGGLVAFGMIKLLKKIDDDFQKGEFKIFPSAIWTNGIITTFNEFTKFIQSMGGILKIFGGTKVMSELSDTIINIDKQFNNGIFNRYPSKSWTDGVVYSISKFSSIDISFLKALGDKILDFFGGGITDIAKSMLLIDGIFSKGNFKAYPTANWVNGVSTSFNSFSNIKTSNIDNDSLVKVATNLTAIDKIFALTTFKSYPSSEWINGVNSMSKINILNNSKDIANSTTDLVTISKNIVDIDKWLSKGTYSSYPSSEWINGSIYAFSKFGVLLNTISSLSGSSISDKITNVLGGDNKMKQMTDNIYILAKSMEQLGKSMVVFNGSLTSLDSDKLEAMRTMTGNIVMMSLMDAEGFERMMTELEKRSSVMSGFISDFEKKKSEIKPLSGAIISNPQKTELETLSKKIEILTTYVADISSVVGSKGALKNYLNSIKEKQIKK